MQAQAEMMRQNLEETQATAEEPFRKEQEYLARITQLEAELAGYRVIRDFPLFIKDSLRE
jgi:hypothetical protein